MIKWVDNEYIYGLVMIDFYYLKIIYKNFKGFDGIYFRFNRIKEVWWYEKSNYSYVCCYCYFDNSSIYWWVYDLRCEIWLKLFYVILFYEN